MSRGLMRSAPVRQPAVVLAGVAAAVAATSGAPIESCFVLVFLLAVQFATGSAVLHALRVNFDETWAPTALSAVLGAAIATIIDQATLWLLGPSRALALAWHAALAVLVFSSTPKARDNSDFGRSAIWLVPVALATMAFDLLWPLGVAIGLAGILLSASVTSFPTRWSAWIGLTLGAAVVVVELDRRPSTRLLPDDRFLARVVESLGQWGSATNPLAYGMPLRYHWGTYAWLGLLSRVTGTGPTQAIQSLGPAVLAVMVAASLVAIAKPITGSTGMAIMAAIMAALIDTSTMTGRGRGFHLGWFESPSQVAALAVACAVLVLIRDSRSQPRCSLGTVALLSLLTFIGAAVKVSVALVILGAVCGYVASARFGRRSLPVAVGTGVAAVVGLALFSESTGVSDGLRRPYWPVDLNRDLWRWYVTPWWQWLLVILMLSIALNSSLVIGLSRHVGLLARHRRLEAELLMIGGGLCGSVVLTVAVPAQENSLYGIQTLTSISTVLVTAHLLATVSARLASRGWQTLRRRLVLCILVGIGIGIAAEYVDVELSDPDAILWWTLARTTIPIVGSLLVAIILRLTASEPIWPSWAVLFVVASVTLGILNWRDQRDSDYREWRSASAERVSDDQRDLTTWIDATDQAAVIASASDVFAEPITRRELVPLVTTIEGYGRVPLQDASRAAVSGPGCGGATSVRSAGADYFVATAEEAAIGALDACAARVYENPSYVVYDLAKAP